MDNIEAFTSILHRHQCKGEWYLIRSKPTVLDNPPLDYASGSYMGVLSLGFF